MTGRNVFFDRPELDRILRFYGRMVAAGEWRDYAMDALPDRALFSVYRRTSGSRSIKSRNVPTMRASKARIACALWMAEFCAAAMICNGF